MGKRRKGARGHGEEEQGAREQAASLKSAGESARGQEEGGGGDIWILLLRFLEFLVTCRSSFSGKQTSQAANGPNAEWRGY